MPLFNNHDYFIHLQDLLVTVFENGHLLVDYTLEEIRDRAELPEVKEALAAKFNNFHNNATNGCSL